MSKKKLKWHVLYIGTNDGIQKYTYYTNPQPGGQFIVDGKFLQKYKFMELFVSTKPIAALILFQLEQDHSINMKNICPVACAIELQNVCNTKEFVKGFMKSEAYKRFHFGKSVQTIFYEFYATKYVNYTMVMHPVGRHYDVFADGKPSLENRVCFVVEDIRSNLSLTTYGRGGAGLNKFCFAILDWNTHHLKQRAVWTDQNNTDLEYSANWYARQGHVDQKFTKTVRENFFGAHPHLKVPNPTDE